MILKELVRLLHDRGIWFHVDGAYGLAALVCPNSA
jgi:glutamate/tyrosine decarboxylase-like PLP-dependent enzyme